MPEMDGYATADWIRTNYEEIKILALSTMDSENAIIKMIHHGAKGYVLKDAEPAELKLAFDEVLKKGYYYNDLVTRRIIQSVTKMSGKNEANVFAKLSEREIQFLKLACSEKTYQQIAAELFVSVRTVDGYREALFEKLQVSSRVGMVMYAIKNGLIIL
jgi:DNA-binding NarL/FixJ family response regulator